MSGFISLLRSVKDEWWWKNSDNIKQWLTLVMMAVYEDKQYVYNNKTVFLKRGQLVTSIRHLASLYGCSKSKTKNFLDLLELMNNIRAEYTRDYTVITILDYDRYQRPSAVVSVIETAENAPPTKRQVGRQPEHKKKNNNKTNNLLITKEDKAKAFLSPEEEKLVYEKLRADEEFWTQLHDALGLPIEDLREMFSRFEKSQLLKNSFHKSEDKIRGHFHDHVAFILRNTKTNNETNEQQKRSAVDRRSSPPSVRRDAEDDSMF